MPYSLFAFPAVLWAVSCAASALALGWNLSRRPLRFKRAFVFSAVGLAIAIFGFMNIHITASETVNDVVRWSINSKWFFLVALALGALSLGMTLWKRARTADAP